MMISRASRVSQLLSLIVVWAPLQSFAQYQNPHYQPPGQAQQPVSGQPVFQQTPTYTAPIETGRQKKDSFLQMIELDIDYPTAVGNAGSGAQPMYGANMEVYFAPLINDNFRNYLQGGYQSFQFRSDTNATLKLIPFYVGLEIPGRLGTALSGTFAIGVGAAYGYLTSSNQQTFSGKVYFAGEVKPGLQWSASEWIDVVLQVPVDFLVGGNGVYFNFTSYQLGGRIKL